MKYKIVDTVIDVNLPIDLEKIWKPFITDSDTTNIKINITLFPKDCYGIDAIDISGMIHSLKNGSTVLFADKEWKNARIYGNDCFEISSLIELQLYSYLLAKDTLLFHSSIVDYKGSGIMFLGPSGIGKTTQAELWNKYTGAEILNGDLVFVKKNKDGFYGYGSPWHGSSPYYENKKVKIKTLVILEQAKENKVRKLEGFETLNGLMKQLFIPIWDESKKDVSLNILDELIKEEMVYYLKCRPDKEAVELIDNILEVK